jgi:hypothetical protein
VKRSDLLDKPSKPGCLYDRSGPEWGSVDLRNGTPVGDLFDALLDAFVEASSALPWPVARRAPGRPSLSENLFETLDLRDDYLKAQERWPSQKLKPLCRLMCKHFTRYRTVKPDTLRKRISQMLKGEEQAKIWDTGHKAGAPQTWSIGDFIFCATLEARKIAKRIEGRKEPKNRRRRGEKNSRYFEGF